MLVGYLFSFILAPVMLSRLGLDKFGVWAVTGAFATYAGLLDLGIGRSLVRFIAIYDAADEDLMIRRCVGLGCIAVTMVGAIAVAAVVIAAPFLSRDLGVLDTEQMRWVTVASVAIWTFNGFQGVLTGIGIGKLEMVPPNIAVSAASVLNFVLSLAALLASRSLVVYALANALAALLALVPAYWSMTKVWDGPYFAIPNREFVREVLVFSLKNQVGWIADLVNFQTDKIVIALSVDIRAAAVYEIASRVVLAVRSAAILTTSAMIPTAAARIAGEGPAAIAAMFRRYLLSSNAIAFPLLVSTSAAAPFLLVTWLGKAPGDSSLMVPFLTLAYLFNTTTGVGSTIAVAAGDPGMPAANSILIAALNVGLTLALAPSFGAWGVITGTFLALTIGAIAFNLRFMRRYDLPVRLLIDGIVPPGLLCLVLAVIPAALAITVETPDSRPVALAWLVVSVVLFGLPYWYVASRREMLPGTIRFPFRRPPGPLSEPR